MILDFVAEQVGPSGNITGKGLSRLLGAPDRNRLEILIREAVQNSWDARLSDEGIEFELVRSVLSDAERTVVNESIVTAITSGVEISHDPQSWLMFVDRGTKGLGGQVRAETAATGADDFINFVFMVGETKSQDAPTGGTYGYGRSSFFNESRHGTVFIYTKCQNGADEPESRLIGMAWRNSYEHGGTRYTGRHWWGRKVKDRVEPLINKEADELAAALGIDRVPDGTTGTVIAVLDPKLDEVKSDKAESSFVSAIKWNWWPRICDDSIQFKVTWNGEPQPVTIDSDDMDLNLFVRAYRQALKEPEKEEVKRPVLSRVMRNKKPMQRVGTLVACLRGYQEGLSGDEFRPGNSVQPVRHIALLREPRMVVKYLEGAAPPEGMCYAAVLVADPEIDGILAGSEPPAHNAWNSEQLVYREKCIVNRATKYVVRAVNDWLGSAVSGSAPVDDTPLGELSDFLGGLVPAVPSQGPGLSPTTPGGGGGSRSTMIPLGIPDRIPEGGGYLLTFPFDLSTFEGRDVKLTASLSVVVEKGGREQSGPAGADEPRITGWDFGTGLTDAGTDELELSCPASGSISVFQPGDAAIRINLKLKEK